uniref:Uncharacterized protein n=1 Tax=Anguilla anguilla TaxID=7936 RepID=A0A0E9PQX0_ANGAN
MNKPATSCRCIYHDSQRSGRRSSKTGSPQNSMESCHGYAVLHQRLSGENN